MRKRWVLGFIVSVSVVLAGASVWTSSPRLTDDTAKKLSRCCSVEEVENILGKARRDTVHSFLKKGHPYWVLTGEAPDMSSNLSWFIQAVPGPDREFALVYCPVQSESVWGRVRRLIGL